MARHDREDPHSLEEQLAWLDAIKENEDTPLAVSATADDPAVSPYPPDPWALVPSEPPAAPSPMFRAAGDPAHGAKQPDDGPGDRPGRDTGGVRPAEPDGLDRWAKPADPAPSTGTGAFGERPASTGTGAFGDLPAPGGTGPFGERPASTGAFGGLSSSGGAGAFGEHPSSAGAGALDERSSTGAFGEPSASTGAFGERSSSAGIASPVETPPGDETDSFTFGSLTEQSGSRSSSGWTALDPLGAGKSDPPAPAVEKPEPGTAGEQPLRGWLEAALPAAETALPVAETAERDPEQERFDAFASGGVSDTEAVVVPAVDHPLYERSPEAQPERGETEPSAESSASGPASLPVSPVPPPVSPAPAPASPPVPPASAPAASPGALGSVPPPSSIPEPPAAQPSPVSSLSAAPPRTLPEAPPASPPSPVPPVAPAGGGAQEQAPEEREPYRPRRGRTPQPAPSLQPSFGAPAGQRAGLKTTGSKAVAMAASGARQTADSLDPVSLLRGRRNAPAGGWRKVIYKASAGLIKPGESPEVRRRRELVARARTPVATGHHRVAILSLKGGVGKTTTTVGLGATLASIRGDRVIAVDANPDRGTLSDKVELETSATVRDLLNERQQIKRYVDIRAFTSQAPSRLEILASDRDPSVSEAFSASDYQAVAQVLENFYSICLTDCGTGLLHSAMSGVLGLADQLVLVSSPSVDGARAASATLDWLEAHHYADLVKAATVVLCSVRPRSKSKVDLDKLEAHFAARCRAVIRVPYDPHLEEGAEIDLDRLQTATRDSYLQLAASVGDGFGGLRG
ncbi:nucleotide-binding protein [Sphaerisporangium fuscum]|uniref:nucleotide-binding protein n=1 Tax=Sphaerisporangium fuscum TaxID=2835868 RepID=UPI0027E2D748|nr:AAA family ATPase [Sphaerisporangium fuscum]